MNKKSLLTCALIAAGVISQASAANVVYLTGSTAFRATVFSVLNSGTTGVFDSAPTLCAYNGSHAAGDNANYMLFHGNISSTDTYIDCAWTGSEAGVASVCNVAVDNDGIPLFGSPATFLKADSTVNPPNGGSVTSSPPDPSKLEASSRQGDIAFADTSYKSSAPSTRTDAVGGQLYHFGTVCAVTFTWVKNNNTGSGASAAKTAWDRLTNVTRPALLNEIANPQTADVFTGNSNDVTTVVYPVGRNKGSGTRANELNDATYGIDTLVNQFAIGQNPDGGISGNNPDGVTLNLLPAFDNNGGLDNGYESGGSVAKALSTPGSSGQTDPFNSNAGWLAIGFLGVSDAGGTLAPNWLTENGVAESDGAIQQGQYTAWGYENMYGRNGISGFQKADGILIFNGLVSKLTTGYSGPSGHDAGIPISLMNASKSTDFSFPTHN